MKKITIVLSLLLLSMSTLFAKFGDIDIHGFLSQGFLKSTNYDALGIKTEKGTLQFNEIGVNFSTRLTTKFRVGLQLFIYDFGDQNNGEVSVDWAFGDYSFHKMLGLRMGKLKVPFGLYNDVRDLDMTRNSIFLPASVYQGNAFRELVVGNNGAELYGTLPYGFSYLTQYGQLDGAKIESYVKMQNDVVLDDVEMDRMITTKLNWNLPFEIPFVDDMTFGYSRWQIDGMETVANNRAMFPPGPTGTMTEFSITNKFSEMNKNVFSIEYSFENFSLAGEFNQSIKEVTRDGEATDPATSPQIIGIINNIFDTETSTEELGYYVAANYSFTEWFHFGLGYSEALPTQDDKDAAGFDEKNFLKDITISTRFDITDGWLVKFETHIMDGYPGSDTTEDEDWYLFALKTSYSF